MANPQVTITLGRSGQIVVKEPPGVSDGGSLSTWVRIGGKRSLEESFGACTDDSCYSDNGWTRGDMSERSGICSINLDDSMLDPNDLRLKLESKRISRHIELEIEERKKAELHEKVSRAIRALESPERSLLTKIPSSSGAAELPKTDSISSCYTSQTTNGGRPKSPDRFLKYPSGFSIPRTAVNQLTYVPSVRHMDSLRTVTAVDQLPYVPSIRHMDTSRTSEFLINDPLESSAEGSRLTNIPFSRGAAERPQLDSISSYISWATIGERPQSPDRVVNYSYGFSVPRTEPHQLPYVPTIRHMDASRTAQFLISDPLESSAEGSLFTSIPFSREAAEPPQLDSISSYASGATSRERPQSADRVAVYFNRFSTPIIAADQLPYVPTIRPTDALRTSHFLISDPLESSVQNFPSSSMTMAHVNPGQLVSEHPPVAGSMFKVPFTDIPPPTVSSLLHSLGLGKYAINFQAEEIDMVALKQMGELDLKELGIPMGPRKKIISALHPRTMRRIM